MKGILNTYTWGGEFAIYQVNKHLGCGPFQPLMRFALAISCTREQAATLVRPG